MKMRRIVSKAFVVVMLIGMLVTASMPSAFANVQELMSKDSIEAGMIDLGTGNTGKLIVQFDVASLSAMQDSFVGFCDSSASPKSENDFPLVFKLSKDGVYVCNNGNEFGAEYFGIYGAEGNYSTIRFVVDLKAGKYDAYITPTGVATAPFATGYSLKPGIAIDDIGKACIYSTNGTAPEKDLFKIMNLFVIPYEVPYGQWRGLADHTKGTYSLGTGNTGVVTTEFDVTFNAYAGGIMYHDSDAEGGGWGYPVILNLDTLDTGNFMVRNGDAYANINPVKCILGQKYHVKMVIDLNNKTYDVFVDNVQIADDYKFRTGQDMDDVGKIHVKSAAGYNNYNPQDDAVIVENHTVNGVFTIPPATPAPTPAPTQAPVSSAPAANPRTMDGTLLPAFLLAAVAGGTGIAVFRKNRK